MYIDGKWMTEPEIKAYVQQIKQEHYTRGFVDGISTTIKECEPEFKALEENCKTYKNSETLLSQIQRQKIGNPRSPFPTIPFQFLLPLSSPLS